MLGCVSGLSTTLYESYKSKETIVAEIQGNILEPIKDNQIELKRGHVRVPFDGGVKKLGEKYYIWLIAPEKIGDYTLLLNDVSTSVSGINKEIDYEQNFSIANKSASYNVKPGALLTNKDFSLDVFLFEDVPKTISLNFLGSGSKELKPGENKISFLIKDVENTRLLNVKVGDYDIPVYVIKPSKDDEKYKGDVVIDVMPLAIRRNVGIGSKNLYYPISIKNNGNKAIDSVVIYSNNPLFKIYPAKLKNMSIGEEKEINLSIDGPLNKTIEDSLYIQAGDGIVVLPVFLGVGLDESNASSDKENKYYCVELGGKLCVVGEVCNGESKLSRDANGSCCLGSCGKAPAAKTSLKWVGWLLLAILIAGVAIVWIKYKKAKPSASGLDKLLKK